jgi:hypothetical protein
MYGGVRGRKTKVGGNYFVFLLLDFALRQPMGRVAATAKNIMSKTP